MATICTAIKLPPTPLRARVVDGKQIESYAGETDDAVVIRPDAVVVDTPTMRRVVEDLLMTGSKLKT